MKFIKGNRKKKLNIRKVAESWNYGNISAYKDAQQSGQLALWILQDMERKAK